jgi:hypothetical protein
MVRRLCYTGKPVKTEYVLNEHLILSKNYSGSENMEWKLNTITSNKQKLLNAEKEKKNRTENSVYEVLYSVHAISFHTLFLHEPGQLCQYSDWLRTGVRSPTEAEDFSSSLRVHTGSGAHPASSLLSNWYRGFFPRG